MHTKVLQCFSCLKISGHPSRRCFTSIAMLLLRVIFISGAIYYCCFRVFLKHFLGKISFWEGNVTVLSADAKTVNLSAYVLSSFSKSLIFIINEYFRADFRIIVSDLRWIADASQMSVSI